MKTRERLAERGCQAKIDGGCRPQPRRPPVEPTKPTVSHGNRRLPDFSWQARLSIGLTMVALLAAGCGESRAPQPIEENFESALIDTTVDFSQLRYADGEISINDRCPIRRNKLNPKVRPLFVNGKPMGFC